MQQDPICDYLAELSAYQYAACDPILNIDFLGLAGVPPSIFTGVATVGTGTGLVSAASVMPEIVVSIAKAVAKASVSTRVWGAVKLVGGILESAAGAAAGVLTSWTGAGAVAGGVVFFHGADVASAGFTQLVTGQETKSFTEKGIKKGLTSAGVSEEKADVAAAYADMTISVVGTGGAGAIRTGAPLKVTKAPKISANATQGVVKATGQSHHLLSNKIVAALEKHPLLKGAFSREDPRFIYNALDDAAHKGYQTWHRQYDDMVVKYIQSNPGLTPTQFKSYLNDLCQQPWLQQRIPNVNLNW